MERRRMLRANMQQRQQRGRPICSPHRKPIEKTQSQSQSGRPILNQRFELGALSPLSCQWSKHGGGGVTMSVAC